MHHTSSDPGRSRTSISTLRLVSRWSRGLTAYRTTGPGARPQDVFGVGVGAGVGRGVEAGLGSGVVGEGPPPQPARINPMATARRRQERTIGNPPSTALSA